MGHIFYVDEIEDKVIDEKDAQDIANQVYQDIESNVLDAIIDLEDNKLAPLDKVDIESNIVNVE